MNTEKCRLPSISIKDCLLILLGSFLYAVSTLLFIFPHSLLLGGTSGISVILEAFLPFSPGSILMVINSFLIVLAFLLLGKEMLAGTFFSQKGGLRKVVSNKTV